MLNRRELLKATGLSAPLLLSGFSPPAYAAAPAMLVHERVPHNAEPPLQKLVDSWITPNDWFYVRSHAPVPEVDVANFALTVEGLVEQRHPLHRRRRHGDRGIARRIKHAARPTASRDRRHD